MAWHTYKVVLRLDSPMHIGWRKLGNLHRTRPFVTGRVLWGALTQRLTRDTTPGPAADSQLYQDVGENIHSTLAFTYFYPTVHRDGMVDLWPWTDPALFGARFLGTYASTALTYPQHGADEGTLHETECIVPNTVDEGRPVYLIGCVFARDGALTWQGALGRLQFGGERGYGWGRVCVVSHVEQCERQQLFDGRYTCTTSGEVPVIRAAQGSFLLAHTLTNGLGGTPEIVAGEIEPLVGREADPVSGRSGVQLSQGRMYYAPGATVPEDSFFAVRRYGIWERTRL